MSLHTISESSVMDITDDSAATHNGGAIRVEFVAFDIDRNHRQAGTALLNPGESEEFNLDHNLAGQIDKMKLNNRKGKTFAVMLFDDFNQKGNRARLTFTPRHNGFRRVGVMVNRAKSLRIYRHRIE